MSIDVELARSEALDGLDGTWNDHVERSPMGTLFHRWEVLDLVAEHTEARLHRLVGSKGDEVIGLLPLFEIRKGPVSALFSPPPGMAITHLGPILANYEKVKQHSFEHMHGEFVDEAIEWAERTVDPKFVRFETVPEYEDARPYIWRDFDVRPRYTYHLPVGENRTEILQRFKRSRRKDILRHVDADYEVFESDQEGIRFVLDKVAERYEAQGKTHDVDPDYITTMYEQLPDGVVRPYVAAVDGEWKTGVITLEYGDVVRWWFGAGKPDSDLPLTDLVHFQILLDASERGVQTCDLVGANTERITNFKSKYNPDLVSYYAIERGTRLMNVVSDIYKKLQ
jgi:hypothetical protein